MLGLYTFRCSERGGSKNSPVKVRSSMNFPRVFPASSLPSYLLAALPLFEQACIRRVRTTPEHFIEARDSHEKKTNKACPTASKRADAPYAFREALTSRRPVSAPFHAGVPRLSDIARQTAGVRVRKPKQGISPSHKRNSRPVPSSVASLIFFVPSCPDRHATRTRISTRYHGGV